MSIFNPGAEDRSRYLARLEAQNREYRATIARVEALANDLDRRGCLSCSSMTGGDDLASCVRDALNGSES